MRSLEHSSFGSRALIAAMLSLLSFCFGCETTSPDREARMEQGYVYYCDGSGGGSVMHNYAGGVRKGLRQAGYKGAGEMFPWHTGLGVTADHTSSAKYKRRKGGELAASMREYASKHPGAPVTLMGLSAGNAVVVYALEELPQSYQVENAFLLAPSISATYDLTEALRRVRNDLYVFSSSNDAVLRFLVSGVGTADRMPAGTESAGIRGFRRPARGAADTGKQYAKVVNIHWRSEFAGKGHAGGHTDVVNAAFVQEYIAPLVMRESTRPVDVATAGKVRNPDYDRWASFAPGSWVRFEGHQTLGGRRQPLHVKLTLLEKQADKLIVEWAYEAEAGDNGRPARVQAFLEKAWCKPTDHPATHPKAKVATAPQKEVVMVKNRAVECTVRTLNVDAEFPDWGRGVNAKQHRNDSVPGGILRALVKSHKGDQPFEISAQVVDYGVAR